MKGYAKINLIGEDEYSKNSKRRTGEDRLSELEKSLTKSGVEYVEDFKNENTVIVRWGAYVNDELFECEVNKREVNV